MKLLLTREFMCIIVTIIIGESYKNFYRWSIYFKKKKKTNTSTYSESKNVMF